MTIKDLYLKISDREIHNTILFNTNVFFPTRPLIELLGLTGIYMITSSNRSEHVSKGAQKAELAHQYHPNWHQEKASDEVRFDRLRKCKFC